MKTQVLIVSREFQKTHKRAGEPTFFREQIHETIFPISSVPIIGRKIHTIRQNYQYWKNIVEKVQAGEAILSIRYWSGMPYKSKQVEICQLDKDSGVGVQEIIFSSKYNENPLGDCGIRSGNNVLWQSYDFETIAENDGLSLDDFKELLKDYDLSKPMAIIHFTKFRY